MAKKSDPFNPKTFLSTTGPGRRKMSFCKGDAVFAEGDKADAIFVILDGRVQLSAQSHGKRGAVLDILSDKDFVGEDCIAGMRLRAASASAMTDCNLLRIGRTTMMRALAREVSLSNILRAYILKSNIRYQRELMDNRCNPSEES